MTAVTPASIAYIATQVRLSPQSCYLIIDVPGAGSLRSVVVVSILQIRHINRFGTLL